MFRGTITAPLSRDLFCPETSVTNYQPKTYSILEERRSQTHGSWWLTLGTVSPCCTFKRCRLSSTQTKCESMTSDHFPCSVDNWQCLTRCKLCQAVRLSHPCQTPISKINAGHKYDIPRLEQPRKFRFHSQRIRLLLRQEINVSILNNFILTLRL